MAQKLDTAGNTEGGQADHMEILCPMPCGKKGGKEHPTCCTCVCVLLLPMFEAALAAEISYGQNMSCDAKPEKSIYR